MVSRIWCGLAVAGITIAAPAWAQTKGFNVPAQDASTGILEFARQADIQILVAASSVEGKRTATVQGDFTVSAGLVLLLAGTDLAVGSNDGKTITLRAERGKQSAAPSGGKGEQVPTRRSATDSSGDSNGFAEVIVTARRREEKLQSVPISVSVVSGAALTAASINNAADLGKLIPSVGTAETNRDYEGYTIRGMSNNNASVQGQSPAITPYFAEVPYPIGDGAGPGRFFDLDGIQVLKGPQGTLFGRNSTGGAVLLQPKKPGNNYDGYIQAQFGNYGSKELQAAVNIPLIQDKLLVRIAGTRAERDGFTKDISSGKDLDNRDYWGTRVGVTFLPTDTIENDLVFESLYSHTNGTSEVVGALDPHAVLSNVGGLPLLVFGNGPSAAAAATAPGRAAAAAAGGYALFPLSSATQILAQQSALGPREVATGLSNPLEKYFSWGFSDIAKWDVAENLTVRNIFGYRSYEQLSRFDEDGTILPILGAVTPNGWNIHQEQYTEELQLQGKSLNDSLVWVAGAFGLFSHDAGAQGNVLQTLGNMGSSVSHPTTRTQAVYGQATYDLGHSLDALDGLNFTAGYRFTWDYRSLDITQKSAKGACTGLGADKNCDVSVALHETEPSWNVGLDYHITDSTMVYVLGRRGFRAGGLNPQSLIPQGTSFKPEVVKDVEIGLKSDWEFYGVKARTDVAAYHTDYTNRQATQTYAAIINGVLTTAPLVVNAGNSSLQGIEADVTVVPFPELELTGAWAYTDAKWDSYTLVDTGQTVPGQNYYFAPQNKFSLIARYTLPIPREWGDVSLSGTWAYQSHQYVGTQPLDPAYTTIGGGYSTFDLALDWKKILGQDLDASLFVTNLTDAVYKLGGYPVYSAVGFSSFVYGEPQMYGVRLRYSFGSPQAEPAAAQTAYSPPAAMAPALSVPKSYLVFFDFNKSDLTPQAVTIVDQAAKSAAPAKITRLTVTGHTDTVGSDAYNMRLSRRRAESVATQLEKDGIPAAEIEIVAKGKRDLLVPTKDGVKEPQNRRVQIVYGSEASS
jgi:iron complex outermembrane receptor protein